MGALIRYDFEGHAIRIYDRNGEPWFRLGEVCEVLGITNTRDAAARLPANERDAVGITDAIGREQQTTIINESALYRLTFRSRKEKAQRFTTWVTSEVLPTIRRTGAYGGISEARAVELIAAALRPIAEANGTARRTTWAEVASDGAVSIEIIESLRLPHGVNRRRVAGRLGAILRDQLARAGIPGPVKRGGQLYYPRSDAMRIAAEHRDLLIDRCGLPRDGRQLELLSGGREA